MPPGAACALQPRGDVDAVAIDVVALDDDVAEIDADAEQHARRRPSGRHCARPVRSARRPPRARLRRRSGNSAISPSPQVLTTRPPCASISRAMASRYVLEGGERALLVGFHQARIALDVGREDGRQLAMVTDMLLVLERRHGSIARPVDARQSGRTDAASTRLLAGHEGREGGARLVGSQPFAENARLLADARDELVARAAHQVAGDLQRLAAAWRRSASAAAKTSRSRSSSSTTA